jgi:formylglycine-generating enzyme required for sulfatase activity
VQSVSWYEAYSFCGKTSGNADVTVRLPTEAEWEYACRAGTETLYSSGDPEADLDSVAWYKKNSAGRPQPVGQKQPNVWGLYDIHGNVSEWCEDWCEPSSEEAQQDPGGPPTGENRVIRGGDWHAPSWACRSAFRWSDPPRISGGTCGFRVVVTVTP